MSVEINFDIGGVEDFRAKMMRLDGAMRRRIWGALQREGTIIKVQAQRRAPVRTGFLRSTIYAKMSPLTVAGISEKEWVLKVGAWAPYARYQEFGTRYIKAREFLKKALENRLPHLSAIVAQALRLAASEAATG